MLPAGLHPTALWSSVLPIGPSFLLCSSSLVRCQLLHRMLGGIGFDIQATASCFRVGCLCTFEDGASTRRKSLAVECR